ncbi:hypothetical protein LguiA_017136 [Lonicera macranthoides]
MARHTDWTTSSSFFTEGFLFVGRATVALLVVWALWSFVNSDFSTTITVADFAAGQNAVNLDPPNPTFYDDPTLSYSIDKPLKNWDHKRKEWLKYHPAFAAGARERIVMVTGTQPKPCPSKLGDHLLLRFFKNKVDYSRIHGYDIFYNNALLHPKMTFCWAKIPLVRATMVAHPEAEWIWWLDSDAAFTDMEFKLPLDKYNNHNFVVHGYPRAIFEDNTWTSLNAGVFLIRNCQWSLDFMDLWASMGPTSPEFEKWGKIFSSTLKERGDSTYADDQSALVYLILKENEKWRKKIHIETEFYFQGYWVGIVPTYDNITRSYSEMEKEVPTLRRRHAEKVSWSYGALREPHMKKESLRRPFMTHFAGCQPCNGKHNIIFTEKDCVDSMEKALNFADNQVLRNFGFVHRNLLDSSVNLVPFDFPA